MRHCKDTECVYGWIIDVDRKKMLRANNLGMNVWSASVTENAPKCGSLIWCPIAHLTNCPYLANVISSILINFTGSNREQRCCGSTGDFVLVGSQWPLFVLFLLLLLGRGWQRDSTSQQSQGYPQRGSLSQCANSQAIQGKCTLIEHCRIHD